MANLRWKQGRVLEKLSENIVQRFETKNQDVRNADNQRSNLEGSENINFKSIIKQINYEIQEDSVQNSNFKSDKSHEEKKQIIPKNPKQQLNDFKNREQQQMEIQNLEFQELNLPNILWSCARLEFFEPKLIEKIIEKSINQVNEFNSQQISNLLWGLSEFERLGFQRVRNTDHFFEISQFRIEQLFDEIIPQGLSNIFSAYARMKYPIKKFSKKLTSQITKNANQFTMQQISNCLWSSATIYRLTDRYDAEMVQILIQQIMNKQNQFNARNVPISLWALAVFDQYNEKVLNLFCESIANQIQMYQPQNISNILWAFANLGFYNQKTLDLLGDYILRMLHMFKGFEVTMCMYALASLNFQDQKVIDKLINQFDFQKINELGSQEICNLLWSVSIFEINNKNINNKNNFLSNIILRLNQVQFQETIAENGLCQIYQSKILCENLEICEKIWSQLNTNLLLRAEKTWRQVRSEFIPSKFDRELFEKLKEINIGKIVKEFTDKNGFFRVDVAVFAKSSNFIDKTNDTIEDLRKNKEDIYCDDIDEIKIAFEADGPFHFTRTKPHLKKGDLVARNKMMEKFGWVVISIPFYEWDVLEDGKKQQYLINKLAQIGFCLKSE